MEFNVKEQVILVSVEGEQICKGEIVNINEFREPSLRYAVQVDGLGDLLFVGKNNLKKLEAE